MKQKTINAKDNRLSADVGGTFTDIVSFNQISGEISFGKTLTTPINLEDGILIGVGKAGADFANTNIFLHGTTIAINTLLERTGAKTALITTHGFRDIYEIGRINRPNAYDFFFNKHIPLIPRSLVFEVTERMDARGKVLIPLDEAQLVDLAHHLNGLKVEAIAILFLHCYANQDHELRAKAILESICPDIFVSTSHELSQEYREFERTSTVVANSYIGPRINKYLGNLQIKLKREKFTGSFMVVQSNGGLYDIARARLECIRMLESGPAAGVIGAQAVCHHIGLDNAIAFDMGGTTAKAGVVLNGEPVMAGNIMVGGYEQGLPIQIPLIDMHEVGTGGGSIAKIAEDGGLRVGPQSSGASPGPVCYDNGGLEPTVTDANLVLGRISANNFLGGEMHLNVKKANDQILNLIAKPLNLTVTEVASGIIRIASSTMANVVKRVTTERGLDAGNFALVAYGGAGPLHACLVARELNIPIVVIPQSPGHFSAYGMLMADLKRDFVRTWFKPVKNLDFIELEKIFQSMEAEGIKTVSRDLVDKKRILCKRAADMRYVGQEHPVSVDLPDSLFSSQSHSEFKKLLDQVHMHSYGFNAPDEPAEIVSLQSSVQGQLEKPIIKKITKRRSNQYSLMPQGHRPVFFDDLGKFVRTPVFSRDQLKCEDRIKGPAVIEEYASSTLVLPGDRLEVGKHGELVITIARGL